MDAESKKGRLTQAIQTLTGISYKLAKGDFKGAEKYTGYLEVIFTQVGMSDLAQEAINLKKSLIQGNYGEARNLISALSEKVNVRLSEVTPHLHLAREIKCLHCNADILKDSKFCSQCGKALS